MKLFSSLLIAAAISMSAGTALAACPDKTASISKDGTHAPLEETNKAPADTTGTVAKDGATMPLATEQGGGNKDLATSQQDVEAQQDGDKTAAAQADADACKD
jgi:hypothetical protein